MQTFDCSLALDNGRKGLPDPGQSHAVLHAIIGNVMRR